MTATEGYAPVVAIFAMAGATYLVRVAGFWLMAHVPMTRRVRHTLEALPGAILAATVVPLVARGGASAALAIAVVVVSMILRRNEFLAVFLGMAAAAAARAAGL
ncbi:MAG: AzlD domain-containing protein [Xanthobacteraceae bacterium]|nr:AzlD domain-containing protein [Burkholderiales bacterium]MCZ7658706.1 AzlD domain-containing protein [Xanthobacteraceae bacterium]